MDVGVEWDMLPYYQPDQNSDLQVLRHDVQLTEATNPFGVIKMATLTVSGIFVEGSWTLGDSRCDHENGSINLNLALPWKEQISIDFTHVYSGLELGSWEESPGRYR